MPFGLTLETVLTNRKVLFRGRLTWLPLAASSISGIRPRPAEQPIPMARQRALESWLRQIPRLLCPRHRSPYYEERLLAAKGRPQNPSDLTTSLLIHVQTAYDAAFMAAPNIPVPVKLREKAQLMTASEMEAALSRIAQEIEKKNDGVSGLGLIGIRRRGVPMAERLGKLIERKEGVTIPVGSLGISFYREDLSTLGPRPVVETSEIELPVEANKIVLVDDVLFTGRTTLAALEALALLGPTIRVQLCVLIDRGHRELPIAADFIGRTVATTMNEVIEVKFMETDGVEKVLLMEKT